MGLTISHAYANILGQAVIVKNMLICVNTKNRVWIMELVFGIQATIYTFVIARSPTVVNIVKIIFAIFWIHAIVGRALKLNKKVIQMDTAVYVILDTHQMIAWWISMNARRPQGYVNITVFASIWRVVICVNAQGNTQVSFIF